MGEKSLNRTLNYKSDDEDDAELFEIEKHIQLAMSDILGGLMEHYREDFKTKLMQKYAVLLQSCFQCSEHLKIGFFMSHDIFNYLEYDAELWNFLIPKCLSQ